MDETWRAEKVESGAQSFEKAEDVFRRALQVFGENSFQVSRTEASESVKVEFSDSRCMQTFQLFLAGVFKGQPLEELARKVLGEGAKPEEVQLLSEFFPSFVAEVTKDNKALFQSQPFRWLDKMEILDRLIEKKAGSDAEKSFFEINFKELLEDPSLKASNGSIPGDASFHSFKPAFQAGGAQGGEGGVTSRSLSGGAGAGPGAHFDQYRIDISVLEADGDPRTTCMIKNIPNKLTQQKMLRMIDQFVPHESYDFFYLPIDLKHRCNLGYAFINFCHPSSIIPLYNGFHGCDWKAYNSNKICEIAYARLQGKSNLVKHFSATNPQGMQAQMSQLSQSLPFEAGRGVGGGSKSLYLDSLLGQLNLAQLQTVSQLQALQNLNFNYLSPLQGVMPAQGQGILNMPDPTAAPSIPSLQRAQTDIGGLRGDLREQTFQAQGLGERQGTSNLFISPSEKTKAFGMPEKAQSFANLYSLVSGQAAAPAKEVAEPVQGALDAGLGLTSALEGAGVGCPPGSLGPKGEGGDELEFLLKFLGQQKSGLSSVHTTPTSQQVQSRGEGEEKSSFLRSLSGLSMNLDQKRPLLGEGEEEGGKSPTMEEVERNLVDMISNFQ